MLHNLSLPLLTILITVVYIYAQTAETQERVKFSKQIGEALSALMVIFDIFTIGITNKQWLQGVSDDY